MTAKELFHRLAPLVAPTLEAGFQRRDLCVLSTRVAIDVADYFGVEVEPVACQMVAYNAAFAAHVENRWQDVDISQFRTDGSYSVGIGFGLRGRPTPPGHWDGHLIVAGGGWFADYSIWQVERPQHGILTGPAVVGEYRGSSAWRGHSREGVTIEYGRIDDRSYRSGPDWRDRSRRRPLAAALIRALRTMPAPAADSGLGAASGGGGGSEEGEHPAEALAGL